MLSTNLNIVPRFIGLLCVLKNHEYRWKNDIFMTKIVFLSPRVNFINILAIFFRKLIEKHLWQQCLQAANSCPNFSLNTLLVKLNGEFFVKHHLPASFHSSHEILVKSTPKIRVKLQAVCNLSVMKLP
jgi:hypothetical protein